MMIHLQCCPIGASIASVCSINNAHALVVCAFRRNALLLIYLDKSYFDLKRQFSHDVMLCLSESLPTIPILQPPYSNRRLHTIL
ncbi:hypothetical protein M431DRAFT_385299 [Trichoderma harzianum CBS 226.95]|uniref:Uncharacterized protein n=1 Tax=Trichoderma harzianum CBS 226.95 TaxID=983964 RepID=A0A2T4AI23_TRIHA|nr:hypothetical protein M431DRAFT_385299 [Trichoderma harzianum CBS 226.95]PTB56721.1 hypothetical protein M431DRAFT_385299 [Trichoderma harzianum CBS 226.95]